MEKLFFEYDDVKVTNTRFINGANTYAMSGITSIKLREKKPNMLDVIIYSVISLILLILSVNNPQVNITVLLLALVFIALAYFNFKKKKTLYEIILSTSGGESQGLISDQVEYTNQVLTALNQAVIYRD